MDEKTLGQIAYEGWRQGSALVVAWGDLEPEQKTDWEKFGATVAARYLTSLDEILPLATAWAAHYQYNHRLADLHPTHVEMINRARALLGAPPLPQLPIPSGL